LDSLENQSWSRLLNLHRDHEGPASKFPRYLQNMNHPAWMELGSADEQKTANEGTMKLRDVLQKNLIGRWYGLKK
jgi:hypothetical protein